MKTPELRPFTPPAGAAQTPEAANLRRPRRLGLPAVLLLCLGCLRFPFWASAQADTSIYEPYSITTLAGLALNSGSTDNTGNLARFNRPYGVAVDGFGTVYVADTGNHSIRKITSGGAVTLLAGIPGTSGSANGANLAAMFSNPTGVAVDSTGNVYVADYNNHLIRQISGGTVSTLAGSVGVAGSNDGTGTAAQFRNPFGVAVNSAGTVVYVSDMNNQTIRRITVPGGVVTTLTGSPNVNGSTDGPNNVALFNTPRGIAVDSGGNIFVSDSGNLTVRKILSGGGVSTLAGAVFTPGFNDGPGLGARFSLLQAISPFGGPCGVAVDAIGNVYVTDQGSTGAGYTIRKITPGLSVTTLAGSVGVAGSTDATGIAVGFNLPAGVAVDSAGKIYVADTVNHTIRVGVDTNCGNSVPVITCPTNKMVNCGTAWTFDAPIATSACGTNLTVSVLNTVTNTGPCSTVITRTWQATSCFGAGMKSWSPLGAGLNGEVWALTEMGGNLYVGGQFTTAGGASANYIAKWNGTSWSQLGSGITNGLNGGVYALAVMGGKLFAAGYFTTAGGVTATNIAQWDGTSWSPLGTGLVAYSAVEALAVIGTDLYVGGGFSTAEGGPGNLIAKYNTLTSVWSPLGSGMNDRVNSLTVVGTDLYAGGQFTSAGGVSANFVAKWNGSNWSALGTGMDFRVGGSLGVLGGNLYAGGVFSSAGGNSANRVAKWDIANSIWSSVGTGINNGMNDGVEGFAVMGTDLYASGGFSTAGGASANRVAQWNGSTWSPLGTGMNNGVWRLAAIGQDLYAGGIFTTAGGLSANYIAKWGADCISISVTCSQTVTIVDTTPPVFTCTNPSVASFSAGTTSDNFVGPEPASPSAGLILRLQSNGVSSLKGFDDNCAINTFFAHTFTNLPLCITKATLSVRLKGCSSSQTYNDSFGLSFTSPSGALVPTSWSRYLGSHNSNPATGLFTDFNTGTTLDVVLDLSQLPNADGSTTDLIPMLNVQGFLDLVIQDDSAIDFAVLTVTSCCATETKTVECGTAWTFDAPTVSDSCSGTNVTLTVLSTVTNGVCPRIITRTWKAADACGNSVTNSQAVTVVDTMPPVLTCATNKTVQCGTAWTFDAPTASDACSTNVTISIFNTVTNGICPKVFMRTWVATDACGNTNTCSQIVTVVDITPPVLTCSNPTVMAFSAGTTTDDFAGLEPAFPSAGLLLRLQIAGITSLKGFDDNCAINTFFAHTFTNLPSCISGATLRVRLKGCVSNYTYDDTFGLSFTSPSGALAQPGWSRYLGSHNSNPATGLFTDFTSGTTLDVVLDLSQLPNADGSTTDLIPTLNAQGLLDLVIQDDSSIDFAVLTVTSCCGTNINTKTVNCGTDWTFDAPTVSDSCSGTNVTLTVLSTVTNGVCPRIITRTWKATDACGNSVTNSQAVTVVDTTPPVLTCATNKTVQCGTAWTFDAPTVSDSCSGTNVTLTVLSTVTNGVCPRIITRTWQATDACGKTNTCSQVVSVVDTTPPLVVCATNKTVQCGTAWTFDAPTASDACSTNVTISIFNTVTNGICPKVFMRTWVATDACGNTNTCSQTVTVVDTICVTCETWTPLATNRVWTAVASSADGSRLVATVSYGLIYTSGNAGLTWTPQNSGNLGWVCVASDSTGQHLVAAANPGQIYISSNFGGTWTVQTSGNKTWRSVASDSTGQYLVAVADNDNIYTSNNSGGAWTARGIAIGLQHWHSVASSADGSKLVAVGYGIPIYTSTDSGLTWTAQTNSGSRDWQSVASSADGSKLVAGVYQGLIYTSGNAGLTWTHNLASSGLHSWDSIASSADGNKLVAAVYNGMIYCSTDSGVSWAGHESNRQWSGVAASSDASKLVAVVYGGGQIYTAACPPAFVLNCATNKTVNCGTAWTFDAPTVSDSCSGTNLTVSILSTVTNGVCPRIITRTWQATDACGNTNTCSQVVSVVDTTPPLVVCATNKTVQCGTAWTFDAPTASDACSTNVTISIFNTVTNGICPRIITRTWKATDACGNTNTCIQIVTVVDTIAPVLIGCQDIITNALHGTTGNYVNYSATAVDGCFGPVPVTFVPPPGSFFPVGTTLVIGTAVDACGNTKTCEFTVTVRPSADACLNITREVITCLTNGGYSYTFSVTNLSTGPIAGFLFAGLPTGVTITPYEVVLPAALAPGQGTTVAVTISSTGCAPTNLCFRLSTYDEHFEACCFFQHCIALQGCCTPHTYTFDADFASGYAVNLNYTNVHDQLQINSKITTFPYVWIASGYSPIDNMDRGSVMKIDAITGVVLGEYRTAPTNSGLNPSRTTVDRFGNCWVANRAEGSGGQGSVAKVALIIGGTRVNAAGIASATGQYLKPPFAYNSGAIDRDNDGLIKTSMGLNNVLPWAAGTSVTTVFPSAADDEAITMFLRVPGSGARSLAVDLDNNLWVGGYSSVTEKDHQKFDTVTGLPLSGIFNNGSGGYGAVIDRNGILWSAGRSSGLFRMDTLPLAPLAGYMGTAGGEYGLSIDPCTDNLWHTVAYGSTNLQANGALGSVFVRGGPSGAVIAGPFGHGNGNAQGVCVDQRGNVFVAHSILFGGATTVGRLTTSGCYVGNIPLTFGGSVVGRGPTGVAVGHDGKIWVSCYQTHNVLRIDPNSPANGFSTGCAGSSWPNWTPIGAVDLVVDLNANGGPTAWPYNYSDNTGFHALGSASPGGFWNVIRDGCVNGLDWGTVSWNSLEPAGTSIKVEVRASDTQIGLAGKPFTAVTKDVSFCGTGIAGRYLEIRTSFYNVGGCNAPSPVLYDLTVDCSCVPENHKPRVEKCPDPFFTPINNASVTHMLSISVTDVDGDPLTVTWSEGGVVLQTNIVPAGVPGVTTAALNFTHNYGPGHHVITILVNDGTSGVFSCTVIVQIGDSKCALITAPTGVSVAAFTGVIPNFLPGLMAVDDHTPTAQLVLNQRPLPGTVVEQGVHLVQITARDLAGNTATSQTFYAVSPVVRITAPANYATFTAPATISVATALAADVTGVARVRLLNGGAVVGTNNKAPYGFAISNLVAGTYLLTAQAVSTADLLSTSEGVIIDVLNPDAATPGPIITGVALTSRSLTFSLLTEPGVTFHVEYSETLAQPIWMLLRTIGGNGSVVPVTDETTNAARRFYRVRRQ